ncbi:transposase [Rhodovulum sulfidophilum]|nr:transposase [Rhodovulum sulfidophilum]
MKKTRFTEAQIMGVLCQMEEGVSAAELCREHGMSSGTLYKVRRSKLAWTPALSARRRRCPKRTAD